MDSQRLPVNPLPGDIILLRITGPAGWLVWLLQALNGDLSPWTHVGVCLDDGTLFEAQPGGAVFTPLEHYAGRPMAIVTKQWVPAGSGYQVKVPLQPTSAERFQIVEEARSRVNIQYNWNTYLFLALYRVHIRPKWLRDRVRDDYRFICSQAADMIYFIVGIDLWPGHDPYETTPGDLARLT